MAKNEERVETPVEDVQEPVAEGLVGEEVGSESESTESTTPPEQDVIDAKEKLEEDVRKLKSMSDRRMQEYQESYSRERAELIEALKESQSRIYELETRDMDEDDKSKYEYQRQLEHYKQESQRMGSDLQQLKLKDAAMALKQETINYWHGLTGVPKEELEKHAQSRGALEKFAHAFIQDLKSKASKPPTPPKVTGKSEKKPVTGVLQDWDKMDWSEREKVLSKAKRGGLKLGEL